MEGSDLISFVTFCLFQKFDQQVSGITVSGVQVEQFNEKTLEDQTLMALVEMENEGLLD